MNLYHWHGDGVLEHYGTGSAIALAESVEQARELVLAQMWERLHYVRSEGDRQRLQPIGKFLDWELECGNDERWREEIAFLDREPDVVRGPVALLFEGSD